MTRRSAGLAPSMMRTGHRLSRAEPCARSTTLGMELSVARSSQQGVLLLARNWARRPLSGNAGGSRHVGSLITELPVLVDELWALVV